MNEASDTNEPALSQKLQYLYLKGLGQHWDDYLKLAAQKNHSHDRFLRHIIDE